MRFCVSIPRENSNTGMKKISSNIQGMLSFQRKQEDHCHLKSEEQEETSVITAHEPLNQFVLSCCCPKVGQSSKSVCPVIPLTSC